MSSTQNDDDESQSEIKYVPPKEDQLPEPQEDSQFFQQILIILGFFSILTLLGIIIHLVTSLKSLEKRVFELEKII